MTVTYADLLKAWQNRPQDPRYAYLPLSNWEEEFEVLLEQTQEEYVAEIEKLIIEKCCYSEIIHEAQKILDEFNPEVVFPVLGIPAIFGHNKSEREKGYSEGFYSCRNENILIIQEWLEKLRVALKDSTEKGENKT